MQGRHNTKEQHAFLDRKIREEHRERSAGYRTAFGAGLASLCRMGVRTLNRKQGHRHRTANCAQDQEQQNPLTWQGALQRLPSSAPSREVTVDAHPFIAGREYRRHELLSFVGSKQGQSGVIWGPTQPGCIICTSGGRHGKKAGYFDERLGDGGWLYFGQGGTGDQSLTNPANSRLAEDGRSVLLFTTREPTSKEIATQGGYGKLFTFQGAFQVADVEFVTPDAGPRLGDSLLRFHFVAAIEESGSESEPALITLGVQPSIHELQQRLIAEAKGPPAIRLGIKEYRSRSAEIHRYARLRAAGQCELCLNSAPFNTAGGIPYLEVHHIHRLADDGPDVPENVAAICPNCHRAAHYAHNRLELNSTLATTISSKEVAILASGISPDTGR